NEIWRDPDAEERAADRARERLHSERLREARDALDQQVALREDRDQHAFEEMVLADDDPLDFIEDAFHQRRNAAAGQWVFHGTKVSCCAMSQRPLKRPQNGDTPIAAAAFSIGTANPMPMNTR